MTTSLSSGVRESFPAQGEIPVDRGAADAQDLADVGGLEALGLELPAALHLPVLRGDLPTAGRAPVGCGSCHPGAGPFGQLVALELGKGRHHRQDGRAHGTGGGDALGQRPEMDVAGFQIVNERQEVSGVASQPVQLPHHHLVLARTQMVEHLVQLGAVGAGSADSVVGEDPLAPGLLQGVQLQLGVLVHRADARISDTGQFRLPGLVKG